ncbi:MAG TPA: hypothetical protein VEJ85_04930 [Thermoplasmata archaeon]|nr:hypothetical protein [Thermoplasmata archaeon]
MVGKPEPKVEAKLKGAGQDVEKHFREMKQKVRDYVDRVKTDHTIKKLLKQDPVAVLWAADLGFWSLDDVRDYVYWEITSD